jgi:hypothetical protein
MAPTTTPVVIRRSNKPHEDPLLHSESSLSVDSENSLDPAPGHVHTHSTTTTISNNRWFQSQWHRWQRQLPCLKKVQETVLRVPPHLRVAFVFFWFCWKIAITLAVMIVFLRTPNPLTGGAEPVRAVGGMTTPYYYGPSISSSSSSSSSPTRILYVMTTLAEYNTGGRATKKGQDRLGEVLIPVLIDSVESLLSVHDYQVDVVLICAYQLRPEREQLIRDSLPFGVGFQVWDDAAPLGYDNRNSKNKVIDNTRALARQHRYVIKDKLFHYDIFLAFEDDMRITGPHVQHYLQMSAEIDRLRDQAPTTLPDLPENLDDYQQTKFHGQMTRQQLSRVVPGFIRVEVLLNDTQHGAQQESQILPIPMDYDYPDHGGVRHVDPEICCHVHMTPNIATPKTPAASDLVMWETNVKAFSLRQLPPGSDFLDWAVLMMGPGKRLDETEKIGGYWSGREGAFGKDAERPSGGSPELIAQQGGWMATRDQIARMNSGLCQGSFLPPFDQPTYQGDGQESMNVEFWSGSYQFFTGVKGGCNMQRIISLHPDHFSKHLLYHVANNKQLQLAGNRMVRADHLMAQLNAVQKMAQRAKTVAESGN